MGCGQSLRPKRQRCQFAVHQKRVPDGCSRRKMQAANCASCGILVWHSNTGCAPARWLLPNRRSCHTVQPALVTALSRRSRRLSEGAPGGIGNSRRRCQAGQRPRKRCRAWPMASARCVRLPAIACCTRSDNSATRPNLLARGLIGSTAPPRPGSRAANADKRSLQRWRSVISPHLAKRGFDRRFQHEGIHRRGQRNARCRRFRRSGNGRADRSLVETMTWRDYGHGHDRSAATTGHPIGEIRGGKAAIRHEGLDELARTCALDGNGFREGAAGHTAPAFTRNPLDG